MTSKMILREALDQIQLVVLLYQELLAPLSLLEGVVVLDKATLYRMLFKLLHSLCSEM